MGVAEDLKKLTAAQALLIGLSLAGVYYFIFFDDGSLLEASIESTRAQVEQVQGEIRKAERDQARVQEYKELMSKMGGSFEKLVNYLPEKMSLADLMKTISNEAKTAGTNINRVKDAPAVGVVKSEFYDTIRVEVELTGSFHSHLTFLSNLTRLQQILIVEKFGMRTSTTTTARPGAESEISMTATIIGYRYLKSDENQPEQGVGG